MCQHSRLYHGAWKSEQRFVLPPRRSWLVGDQLTGHLMSQLHEFISSTANLSSTKRCPTRRPPLPYSYLRLKHGVSDRIISLLTLTASIAKISLELYHWCCNKAKAATCLPDCSTPSLRLSAVGIGATIRKTRTVYHSSQRRAKICSKLFPPQ